MFLFCIIFHNIPYHALTSTLNTLYMHIVIMSFKLLSVLLYE